MFSDQSVLMPYVDVYTEAVVISIYMYKTSKLFGNVYNDSEVITGYL